jgi:AraC-like DNA-binding protein
VVSLLRLLPADASEREALLEHAGLDFDPLESGARGWRPEVSAMQYSRIYQRVLARLGDESFGLKPGVAVSPGAFRMMCYCVISCENLGRAIQRAAEFYRTLFSEQTPLFVSFTDVEARVGYREATVPGESRVEALDAYALSAWHRFFGWLTGRPLDLLRVDFTGEEPASPGKYRALFGCPVHFGQPANLMYFDAGRLRLPIVHTEESVDEFLRTAPYQLLTMTPERYSRSLVTRVRALIGHDFSEGFPGFERVSRALNMSAPTLRRRLKKEGASFQQIKDECRREAACKYLEQRDLSINTVATRLGFTDPSAFHRSFKKWTGMTPGAYRATVGGKLVAPAPN